MLSKVCYFVNQNTIRTLYFSLFSSHMSYCCQVWGQTGSHLNKISSIQRFALRIINFKPFRYDVTSLFLTNKISLFSNIVRIANLMFVFDSINCSLPVSILNFFIKSRDTYSYITHGAKNGKLILPKYKSVKYGKNSIKYRCVIEWNKSVKAIRNIFDQKYENSHHYKNFLDLSRIQFKKLISKIII